MTRPVEDDVGQRWRRHAVVLAFGTFAVGTDAFVIAGVIPSIGRSLHVSVAAAGQLVTVFSIAYAVLSPVLAALTSRLSRRTVLVAALGIFAVGNVATALAPSYALVLLARIIAGAGAAMFTPNAGATAAVLAGPARRGRAIAIVTVGLTSSVVLGAPLGTAIGNAFGWQATMWFVTALAVMVAPIIAFQLPDIKLPFTAGLRQRLAPLTDRRVLLVLVGTLLAFIGVFLPYTYISAVYSPVIAANHGNRLAILLLVYGLVGTAGNLVAGRLADRSTPSRVVIGATLVLTAVFLLTPLARESFLTALPAVAIFGFASWSLTGPQQNRVIALASPGTESLVVSLNAAVLYLAISLSSVIGAIGLAVLGPVSLPLLAAVFTALAATFTWLTTRPNRPTVTPTAESVVTKAALACR